jgi:hypothetical protein
MRAPSRHHPDCHYRIVTIESYKVTQRRMARGRKRFISFFLLLLAVPASTPTASPSWRSRRWVRMTDSSGATSEARIGGSRPCPRRPTRHRDTPSSSKSGSRLQAPGSKFKVVQGFRPEELAPGTWSQHLEPRTRTRTRTRTLNPERGTWNLYNSAYPCGPR